MLPKSIFIKILKVGNIKIKMFTAFLVTLICWNVASNYHLCNFRSRHDWRDMMSCYRNELTPGTFLIMHIYEYRWGMAAFYHLDYIRRDFYYFTHHNKLDSKCIAKYADLFLPAFLDLKNRSKDRTMFYVIDKKIDENYTLVPIPTKYPLRFIVGHLANLRQWQGFEERQVYYVLPKESIACTSSIKEEVNSSNFNKYKQIFLNNWEALPDNLSIQPKDINIPSNILICAPKDDKTKKVTVKMVMALNPNNDSKCPFKRVEFVFYLNNVIIKQETIASGESAEIIISIPAKILTRRYNFLAIVPFYNSLNSLTRLPEGYPYILRSLSITEQ